MFICITSYCNALLDALFIVLYIYIFLFLFWVTYFLLLFICTLFLHWTLCLKAPAVVALFETFIIS